MARDLRGLGAGHVASLRDAPHDAAQAAAAARTAHCPLLTAHCCPYSTLTTLLFHYQAVAAASPRAVSHRLRGGGQPRGHPRPLRLGRHSCWKGPRGRRTPRRFVPRASLAPHSGPGCSAHSRGAPWSPRPQWQPMVLPQLTAHHSPHTTYHSRRPTTCSRCRLISRRRPLSQRPRWPTHSPRSPPSPQHDRASSSPPPRSPRCAGAARAAAVSRARAPPSPQGCGSCLRQPRCSPTAPPTGAAAPARSTAMHRGLPPQEPGAAAPRTSGLRPHARRLLGAATPRSAYPNMRCRYGGVDPLRVLLSAEERWQLLNRLDVDRPNAQPAAHYYERRVDLPPAWHLDRARRVCGDANVTVPHGGEKPGDGGGLGRLPRPRTHFAQSLDCAVRLARGLAASRASAPPRGGAARGGGRQRGRRRRASRRVAAACGVGRAWAHGDARAATGARRAGGGLPASALLRARQRSGSALAAR